MRSQMMHYEDHDFSSTSFVKMNCQFMGQQAQGCEGLFNAACSLIN